VGQSKKKEGVRFMSYDDFNQITAKRQYTYRKNPLHQQSFVILKQQESSDSYEPVGDYTVLDTEEKNELSERKVMNLVSLMNDDEQLIDLRGESDTRILFHRAYTDEPDKTKIIFYALGKTGVSKENAVLSLAEELE
jgi:hypothetical protein